MVCRVGVKTNHSQRTKSGPAVHFCELSFIGHSHAHLFMYGLWLLLSNYGRVE